MIVEILPEATLASRRYPSVVKTRKGWNCRRCGLVVEKGGKIEHSYSNDMKLTIELCLPCTLLIEAARVNK